MNTDDQIKHLLENTTFKESLPLPYNGILKNEFETIVMLTELSCTLILGKKINQGRQIFESITNLILLINKFYFSMKGENAPRLTKEDLDLAHAHGLNNIPIESTRNVFAVDERSMYGCITATSNICGEMIKHVRFVMSEFCDAFSHSKEQCKRARKYGCKIVLFLNKLLDLINKEKEAAHQYVNQSSITFANMTHNERKLSQRKRRNR